MRKALIQVLPFVVAAFFNLLPACGAQAVDVRARVVIVRPQARKSAAPAQGPAVVVWLKPLDPPAGFMPPPPGHFRMAQKNKTFEPHLLVVPIGSTVSFPNLDPFFHNVFSQFNGKRFDLGLYEAGSTRDVRFDHEGVSYLFCNIHPEMSAVIITMSTPWYAISSGGEITLQQVPPGQYVVHVWAEGATVAQLDRFIRRVRIGPDADNLGTISIQMEPAPPHKNKFGEDYRPEGNAPY
ncbi:MAG TPA: hypothetical protein VGG45_08880 [Terracidiphilus sp.]|jgi:hypothetical protein